MPLLAKPVQSRSYKSWVDLFACGHVVVQRRSAAGLSKNSTLGHRIAFQQIDQAPYRILFIASTEYPSYGRHPGNLQPDHELDDAMAQANRYVIATAQSRNEAIADWADIRRLFGWKPESDTFTIDLRLWAVITSRKDGGSSSPAGSPVIETPLASAPRFPVVEEVSPPPRPVNAAVSQSTIESPRAAVASESASPPRQTQDARVQHHHPTGGVKTTHTSHSTAHTLSAVQRFGCALLLTWTGYHRVDWCIAVAVPAVLFALGAFHAVTAAAWIVTVTLNSPRLATPPPSWAVDVISGSGSSAAAPLKAALSIALSLFVSAVVPEAWYGESWLRSYLLFPVLRPAVFLAWLTAPLGAALLWGVGLFVGVVLSKRKPKATSVEPAVAPPATSIVQETQASGSAPIQSAAAPVPLSAAASSSNGAMASALPESCVTALNAVVSGGWTLAKDDKGVQFFSKPSPWSDKAMCKFITFFPGVSVASVPRITYDDPDGTKGRASNVYKFDKLIDERLMLGTLPTGESIWHSKFKRPAPFIAARDTIGYGFQTCLSRDEQVQYGFLSADSAETPVMWCYCVRDGSQHIPPIKDSERSTIHCYGLFAQQRADGVAITMVLAVDPRGKLPKSLVDVANFDQINKLNIIKDLAAEDERVNGRSPPESLLYMLRDRIAAAETRAKAAVAAAALPAATAAAAEATAAALPRNQVERLEEPVVRALELMRSTGWQDKKTKDGVKFVAKASPWCNKQACWFSTTVTGDVTAEDFEAILCDDPDGTLGKASSAFQFDRLLESRSKLRDHKGRESIWRTSYISPVAGVGPRDMVTRFVPSTYLTAAQMAQYGFTNHSAVFIQCAIDHGKNEPAVSGYTRGAVHSFAIIAAQRSEGGVDLHLVMSIDPQGWILAKMVELTNDEQMEKTIILKRLALEGRAKRAKVA